MKLNRIQNDVVLITEGKVEEWLSQVCEITVDMADELRSKIQK